MEEYKKILKEEIESSLSLEEFPPQLATAKDIIQAAIIKIEFFILLNDFIVYYISVPLKWDELNN